MEGNCSEIPPVGEDGQNSPTKTGVAIEEVGKTSPSDRSSPETNCAICLGKPQNKSFTDSCLHQFCFTCLLEWSKVKAECPLCKQSFKSIIHNVRSIEDYEQYYLRPAENRIPDPLWPTNERFRYRTTMSYLQYFIRLDEAFANSHIIPPAPAPSNSHMVTNWRRRRQNGTSDFRRNIYRQGLYVQRTPDISGRYRTSSPEFYRLNPAQVHRLVPWLNRELNVLLNESRSVNYVMNIILDLITRHEIRSPQVQDILRPYFGDHTQHFIHEFHSFATSPFDMISFDRNAEYVHRDSIAHVEEVQSSSSDSDSDVQVVGTYTNVEPRDGSVSPVAGPSGILQTTYVDVESDSDDCLIIGTLKPKHERTPEIITLDSDPEVVDVPPNVTVTVKTSYSSDSGLSDIEENYEEPSTSYRISTRNQVVVKNQEESESNEENYSPVGKRNAYNDESRARYYQPRVVWYSDSSSSDSSSSSNEEWSYNNRKMKQSKAKKKKATSKKRECTRRKSYCKDSKKRSKSTSSTSYWKNKICSKSEVDTSSSSVDSSRTSSPVIQTRRRRSVAIPSSSPELNIRNMQEHNYSTPYSTDEIKKFMTGRPRLKSVVTVRNDDSAHSSTTRSYTSQENSRTSDLGRSSRRTDSDDDFSSLSRHRANSYSPAHTSQKYESDHSASMHAENNGTESYKINDQYSSKYNYPSSSHHPHICYTDGPNASPVYKRVHSGNNKYPPKKRKRDS